MKSDCSNLQYVFIGSEYFYSFTNFSIPGQTLNSTSGFVLVFSPAEKETGVANRCNDDQCDAHH